MTIECYYKNCFFHSYNENDEEGPYCYEEECKATDPFEMRLHTLARMAELKKWGDGEATPQEVVDALNEAAAAYSRFKHGKQ